MSSKRITPWLLYSLIAMFSTLFLACASAPQSHPQQSQPQQSNNSKTEPRVEAQATPSANSLLSLPSPAQQAATNEPAKLPPPKPTAIKVAVARVFERPATSDIESQQSFVVGDFNGDGSEDLAVIVKPNEGSLREINSEVANWTLEDPGQVAIPGTNPPRPSLGGKTVQDGQGQQH